jgi:hypothetical protein
MRYTLFANCEQRKVFRSRCTGHAARRAATVRPEFGLFVLLLLTAAARPALAVDKAAELDAYLNAAH